MVIRSEAEYGFEEFVLGDDNRECRFGVVEWNYGNGFWDAGGAGLQTGGEDEIAWGCSWEVWDIKGQSGVEYAHEMAIYVRNRFSGI
jgi:hypothetical protein